MKIRTFYDDIFQYHYEKLVGIDSDPIVMPLAIISISQSAFVFCLYIILFFVFDLGESKQVYWAFLIIYIITLILNVYVYLVRNRKESVLSRNKTLSKNFGMISGFYLTISMIIPFAIIYMFMELL